MNAVAEPDASEGNMARPIKETPTLYGKDARIFIEKNAHPKPVSAEAYLRAKRIHDRVMAKAKFVV